MESNFGTFVICDFDLSDFGISGWIQNGIDILNPFVLFECPLVSLTAKEHQLKKKYTSKVNLLHSGIYFVRAVGNIYIYIYVYIYINIYIYMNWYSLLVFPIGIPYWCPFFCIQKASGA